MRRTTILITMAACALVLACGVAQGGEIARWQLDETTGTTAVDSTGGFNGVIAAGTVLGQPGKLGTAFQFDGSTNTSVIVADGVGFENLNEPRSIAGWARATTLSQTQWSNVFGFAHPDQGGGTFFDVEVDDQGRYVTHCYGWERVFQAVDLNWHFFVATHNGGNTIRLYLDGAFLTEYTDAPTPAIQDRIQIGWRNAGAGFRGIVDDVRIYDAVLSDVEIADLYQAVPPSVQRTAADDPDNADSAYGVGDTLALTFDTNMNGSGTVATDLSGADMDLYFALNNGHTWGTSGLVATGVWADARTLVLTIASGTGGTVAIGDIITIPSSAHIGNSSGSHLDVQFVCPPIDGDWGMPPDDALAVHYTCDDTAGTVLVDSAGGYDATLVNCTLPEASTPDGQVDGAIEFKISLEHAVHDRPAGLQGLADFTVTAWFRPDAGEYVLMGTPIVSLAEFNPNPLQLNKGFALMFNSVGDGTHQFGILTYTVENVFAATSVQLGTWYHVAATYESATGEQRIYVNGALAGTGNKPYVPTTAADLRLGLSPLGSSSLVCGLDDVRIYRTALSAAYISAICLGAELTLAVTDAVASEAQTSPLNTGAFTITRTVRDGALLPAVAVALNITGSADDPDQSPPDYDIAVAGGSGLTPAGAGNLWTVLMDEDATTMTLTVEPTHDLDAEGDETVIIALSTSDAYGIGSPNSGTVTIVDDDMPLPFALVAPLSGTREVDPATGIDFEWERPAGTTATSYTLVVITSAWTYPAPAEVTVPDPGVGTTVTYHLPTAGILDTDMHLYWMVTAVSAAGETTANNQPFDFFTTDTIAPLVTGVSPRHPDIDENITVTFSEAMDFPADLTTVFTFAGPGGAAVGGAWSGASGASSATFNPSSDLEYDTTYTITVAATVADMAYNAVANGPYTDTVTTLTQMGGVGIGGGCASTEGSAPLGVALVVLAAFGLAVMLRKRGARAAAGVLAVCLAMTLGCAGAPLTYEASPEGTLSAPSVASLSLYDYGSYEGEYAGPSGKKEGGIEAKWAARAGMVLYLGTEVDVPPRLTMGAFARMLETDSTRVEVGIDLTPELGGDSRTNVYGTLSGDFVGFIDDTFYWKAGGGVILEQQDSTNYFLGILEGGAGMWFGVGEENAAVVNVIFQIPLGDANPAMMLAITGAYEF